MHLETLFQQAVAESRNLGKKPDNTNLLNLYALYKQATEGDISPDSPLPQMFDFVGKAKYDAWKKLSGKSPEQAKNEYISLIEKLKDN